MRPLIFSGNRLGMPGKLPYKNRYKKHGFHFTEDHAPGHGSRYVGNARANDTVSDMAKVYRKQYGKPYGNRLGQTINE